MNETALLSGIQTPDNRLRVFISSTLGELHKERELIRAVINDLTLTPVMFETGARPQPPREWYRTSLQLSDIYIGVFWESYGWVAPDMSISGIEDEWNFSKGKAARLVYVKEPSPNRDPRLTELLNIMSPDVTYTTFRSDEELVKKLKDDVMLVLTERFRISEAGVAGELTPEFGDQLRTDAASRHHIERQDLVAEVKGLLSSNRRVLIQGDPGVGKTSLLSDLAEQPNSIYISLTGRSPQGVLAHVANRIRFFLGLPPHAFPSEEEARNALESVAARFEATLLFDHLDQNPSAAEVVCSLDLGKSRAVFATRASSPNRLPADVATLEVPGFTEVEARTVLTAYGLNPSEEEFQDLYESSKGNPLYLFYFANEQIHPLPRGLHKYQRALFDARDSRQKELIGLVALSREPRSVNDLSKLLSQGKGGRLGVLETKALVDSCSPIVSGANRRVEVFHPLFAEFVNEHLIELEADQEFHLALGEAALDNDEPVQAAYHLEAAKDDRRFEVYQEAMKIAWIRGETSLAEHFSRQLIASPSLDAETESFVRFFLAQVLNTLGRRKESRQEAEHAKSLRASLGQDALTETIDHWLVTLDVEEGRADEALRTLNSALPRWKDNPHVTAIIYVNIAFVCIRTSMMREAIDASEKALELFQSIEDRHGELVALGNLAAALSDLEEMERLEKIAPEFIRLAEEANEPRFQVMSLNVLARTHRLNDRPQEAQKILRKAISVCKRCGYIEPLYMYTLNLGNSFRDEGNVPKAEEYYNEALHGAREHGFPSIEAHSLELIASIRLDNDLSEKALELTEDALRLLRITKEPQRLAAVWKLRAKCFEKLNLGSDSALAWSASALALTRLGEYETASGRYQRAASKLFDLGEPLKALEELSKSLRAALKGTRPSRFLQAASLLDGSQGENAENLWVELLIASVEDPSSESVAPAVLGLLQYVKRNIFLGGRALYNRAFQELSRRVNQTSSSALLSTLAIFVEQSSPELLNAELLSELELRVAEVEGMYFRGDSDSPYTWTVGIPASEPVVVQITSLESYQLTRRFALALALTLRAFGTQLGEHLDLIDGPQGSGLSFVIVDESDFKSHLLRDVQNPGAAEVEHEMSSDFLSMSTEADENEMVVIRLLPDYEQSTDWLTNEGSREWLWVLMNLHQLLVKHLRRKTNWEASSEPISSFRKEFCDRALSRLFAHA